MFHIVEQTHEERVAMYMRLKKKELAEMLANQQETWSPAINPDTYTGTTWWSWPPDSVIVSCP